MPTTYNKVELDGTTLLDLSQDTVASASHIRQGYVGHLNDGAQVTGTYSGDVNMPIYTAAVDGQTGTITVTCDWTYQEVEDYYLYNGKFSSMLRTTTDGVDFIEMPMSIHTDSQGVYGTAIADDGLPSVDLLHTQSGIVPISPSSALAQLTATQNGTYYAPQGKLYNEVEVNVSGGQPTIEALTVTPSTSQQTFNAGGVDGYKPVTVNAMPSGTAGTPTATKGAVSNHSVSVTPSVTNQTGYITGSTKTGTAVTVSASELVSGSETKTANGTYDVTNLASLVVNVSGASGVKTGTLTVASNVNTSTSTQITTTNAIGFTPKKFFFYRSDRSATSNHVNQASFVTLGSSYYVRTMTRYSSNALSTSGNANNWTTQTAGYLYFNNSTIYFRSSSSYILPSGTWYWIAAE